jgi:hypothetical protein
MPQATETSLARRAWPAFSWAAFLACSWTWCIGMFLPVLLLRDFGMLGYIVFFLPNVLGAAAMGWMFRSAEESREVVRRHGGACRAFSILTIAFQVYFGAWLFSTAGREMWIPLLGVMVIAYALFIAARGSLRAPIALWLISAAAFAGLLLTGHLQLPRATSGVLPGGDVLFLVPVVVFGFLLCPYLDLTFHGAVQQAGANRRAAFTLGFGGLFSVMLLFTLFYAPLLLTQPQLAAAAVSPWVLGIVLAHIAAQLVYTLALHHSFLIASVKSRQPSRSGTLGLELLAVGFALVGGALAPHVPGFLGLSFGELGYRVFMGFYGLVFPAYVWICMIPTRRTPGLLTRPKLLLWMLAVSIAAPSFALGFLMRQTWALGVGMAIVLLARLLVGPVSAAAPARRSA